MRKIIFRGRRINSTEWVRGGISPTALNDGYSISSGIRSYAVDQGTIGQYTGMNDRNGAPIYEDDLVTATHADGEGIIRGRVRFGLHAPTMSQCHFSQGFWIEWAADEFLRKELGFWRERLTVIGPWADQPRTWDRWCEEAAALERARNEG